MRDMRKLGRTAISAVGVADSWIIWARHKDTLPTHVIFERWDSNSSADRAAKMLKDAEEPVVLLCSA